MNNLPSLSLLIEELQKGNELAFREFYNQTKSRVFTLALGYVRNREDAEEITQDVFVEVFRSASSFKGDASATTWLYRIAVNKSLDFLKHKKRQKRFAFITNLFDNSTGEILHQPTDFFHPGIALENQEQAAILFRAIDKLSDKQKTAFILTRIEGLTNIEAAGVMTVTVGAIESLLQRANENLKKQLSNFYKSIVVS
ncbi:sigma-70 family RNA polymerase sigma factor [Spirosoma sp. HMF3257]|uniref:RNA polymerase sigma factor n=2 Tax=Spirosoma telluris TaxID=2183553 RepID=A0A327NTN3_9BACT|nr:sigma-70 family RNA polymerase sigma factor [Spirosoma telluris]RAI78582.1 RNA polymerase sigma factor [Spirosoma telluris]